MPPLQLLGFARLRCGCLIGRYLQRGASREVDYVEDKGCRCSCSDHRLHELLSLTVSQHTERPTVPVPASALIAG